MRFLGFLALLVCLHLGVRAQAEEPVQADEVLRTAVQRAQELAKEADEGALIALALSPDPDPWIVVDELVGLGDRPTALLFAKAALEAKGDGMGALAWLKGGGDAHESPARRAALRDARQLASERKHAESLARLDEAHGGFADVLAARCSLGRGFLLRALKEPERSIRSFLRAASIAADLGWIHQESLALHEAAMTAFRRAEHARAADAWQRRVALEKQRGVTPDLIATLENLGLARANLGEFAAALADHSQALDICRTLGDAAGVARALVNIGVLHDRRGDAVGARQAYEEALELLEASAEQAQPQEAIGHETMACEQWGDFTEAIARCQHSMEVTQQREEQQGSRAAPAKPGSAAGASVERDAQLLERIRKNDDGYVQQALAFSLGKLYRRLGRTSDAQHRYQLALDISEEIGDLTGKAQALASMAQLHADAGENEAALEQYARAIEIQQQVGDRVGEAWSRVYRGDVYLANATPVLAVEEYEAALGMLRDLSYRTSVVVVLARLSRAYAGTGRMDAAMASAQTALKESLEIGDEGSSLVARQTLARIHMERGEAARALEYVREAARDLRQVAHGLSVADGISTREYFGRLFELAAKAALSLDDPEQLLFVLEMGRAGTLLEALGSRGTVRSFVVPPKLQEAEEAGRAAEAEAQRRLMAARAGGDRKEVRARREDLDRARAALSETIDRIQLLSRSAADMVYSDPATLKQLQVALLPREALILYGVFEEQAVALAVGSKWARIVHLGPSADVRAAVNAADLSSPTISADASLAALNAKVIEPLKLGSRIERLLISPHGALHTAPFAALVPHMEVTWLPSATTWLLLTSDHHGQGKEVLALGDPRYEAVIGSSTQAARSGSGLAPLPATREEVLAVGDVLLLGDEASEQNLRDRLDIPTRWRAVHLACHGLLDAERPWQSCLALSPDSQNDGFLTVLDLLRLRVASDLAVLSACETGRGAIYSAEGILGLSRAFMHAGAPRVLASLWKVDDDATRELMNHFYEIWNPPDGRGVGAAEALRRAQAHVRAQEKWKHPYYWAAWVLWGLPE